MVIPNTTARAKCNDNRTQSLFSRDISQKGSNITAERLRFDFSFPRSLTQEELSELEAFVNKAIREDVSVECVEMSLEEARKQNATGVFGSRYGEAVKVYTIQGWSKEICGGPHASHTGELGLFKIQKEQSSSAGVRRIRATLGE
jgi:alanyl-tRNA synthetase